MKVIFSSSDLEVVFYDAQIYFCIESDPGLKGDGIFLQDKSEFLLIHGCGGEKCCLYAFGEPVRPGFFENVKLFL